MEWSGMQQLQAPCLGRQGLPSLKASSLAACAHSTLRTVSCLLPALHHLRAGQSRVAAEADPALCACGLCVVAGAPGLTLLV